MDKKMICYLKLHDFYNKAEIISFSFLMVLATFIHIKYESCGLVGVPYFLRISTSYSEVVRFDESAIPHLPLKFKKSFFLISLR